MNISQGQRQRNTVLRTHLLPTTRTEYVVLFIIQTAENEKEECMQLFRVVSQHMWCQHNINKRGVHLGNNLN